MGSIYFCIAVSFFLTLTRNAIANLQGYDLVFNPEDPNIPRALLINEEDDPVGNVTTDAFTICLFAKLQNYVGLKIVDLFSFSSRSHDEVNEIVIEIDYEDDRTNLYLHGTHNSFHAVPPLDEWTHMCFTWESKSGIALFYVDGVRIGKTDDVQPGYIIGGNGYFVLGQDQDSFNGGFDPESGVHGKLTQFNLWNRVLTKDEVRQVQHCKTEGNVVRWSDSIWSLLGSVQKENSENPCRVEEGASHEGCECNNAKMADIENSLLTYKYDLQAQLNETKRQMANIEKTNKAMSRDIVYLTNRTNTNEKDILSLRQLTDSYTKEVGSLKQAVAALQGTVSNLEKQNANCEKEIAKENVRLDNCERSLNHLQQNQSSIIIAFQEAIQRVEASTKSCCSGNTNNAKECPRKFVNIAGECYYFSTDHKNSQYDASRECNHKNRDSHLLSISSKEEYNNIQNYINSQSSLKYKNWWFGKSSGADMWDWLGSLNPLTNFDWRNAYFICKI